MSKRKDDLIVKYTTLGLAAGLSFYQARWAAKEVVADRGLWRRLKRLLSIQK